MESQRRGERSRVVRREKEVRGRGIAKKEEGKGKKRTQKRTCQSFSCGEYRAVSAVRKHSESELPHNLFKGPSSFK